jgi:hypothetical protein
MSNFRNDWRGALADVQENGAIVAFTAPGLPTIAGYAMAIRGDPRVYEAAGLTEKQPQTLLFVPTTFGVLPSLLPYSVMWAGQSFVVKHVNPTAPDGNCILAHVVVIR